MKTVDYIIVGCGLAGIAFCEKLRANQKRFIVFDNKSQQSSTVAAGLYNPVILKRFTPVWRAKEQLEMAIPVYAGIEEFLNIKIDYPLQILRRFASIEEQNQWFSATDQPALEPYMSTELIYNSNTSLKAPFGFGEVLKAGRLDTAKLVLSYRSFLSQQGLLRSESFNYADIKQSEEHVEYSEFKAQHIVFAEGFGVKDNPFFKDISLNGTKGEVLTLRIPGLNIDYAVKSSVFVIPLGEDLYTVGSTYNWHDKSNEPTAEARNELLTKLSSFMTGPYELVKHEAGIRPTVNDRRPIVGRHKEFSNFYVLNGLGTRGVMIAPYVADQLFHYIERQKPLVPEIDLERFKM